MSSTSTLPQDALVMSARDIAVSAYKALEHFPEDEKWIMTIRLRQNAFYVTDELSGAAGAPKLVDKLYHFGQAQRALFSVRNVYVMAHRTGILTIDPDEMVAIDTLAKDLEQAIAQTQKEQDQEQKDAVAKDIKATEQTKGRQ